MLRISQKPSERNTVFQYIVALYRIQLSPNLEEDVIVGDFFFPGSQLFPSKLTSRPRPPHRTPEIRLNTDSKKVNNP